MDWHATQPGPARPLPWLRPHVLVDAPLIGLHLSLASTGHYAAFAALSAGLVALHGWASMYPRSNWYLRGHSRLPANERGCALTFDDGPHPEYTPRILDLLAQHGARATFFVIGRHVEQHGSLLRRMLDEGHTIGLHSHHHHRSFNMQARGKMRGDVQRCAAAVADATGAAPPRLFRPPIGLRSPQVADVIEQLGLVCVMWSGRAWDTGGANAATITANLRKACQPRAIVLCHDGHEPNHPGDRGATIAALAELLPTLSLPTVALHPGVGNRLANSSTLHAQAGQ